MQEDIQEVKKQVEYQKQYNSQIKFQLKGSRREIEALQFKAQIIMDDMGRMQNKLREKLEKSDQLTSSLNSQEEKHNVELRKEKSIERRQKELDYRIKEQIQSYNEQESEYQGSKARNKKIKSQIDQNQMVILELQTKIKQ